MGIRDRRAEQVHGDNRKQPIERGDAPREQITGNAQLIPCVKCIHKRQKLCFFV